MNNVYTIIPVIFITCILYLMFYFMPKLSSKKLFYGVLISQEYYKRDEFQSIDKSFKRNLTILFAFIICLSIIISFYTTDMDTIQLVTLLGFLVIETLMYVKTHKSVLALKKSLSEEKTSSEPISIVDTDFLRKRDSITKRFKLYFGLNYIVVIVISIYSILNYNDKAKYIPIHWNIYGKADGYVANTFTNFLSQIGLLIFMMTVITVLSIYTIKSRVKFDTLDLNDSKERALELIKKTGYSFLLVAVGMTLLFVNIFTSIANNTDTNMYIGILTSTIVIVGAISSVIFILKSDNLSATSTYSPDDDESNWKFGLIYYNRNDPSFMIPKRFGIGWSINAGHPLGFAFYALILLILLYSILKIFVK